MKELRSSLFWRLVCCLVIAIALNGCTPSSDTPSSPPPNENSTSPHDESETPNGDDGSPSSVGPSSSLETTVDDQGITWTSVVDLESSLDTDVDIIDTRTAAEFMKGSIPSAVNLPARFLTRRYAEVLSDTTVVFVCETTDNAIETHALLLGLEISMDNFVFLEGGMEAWMQAGYPVEEHQITRC